MAENFLILMKSHLWIQESQRITVEQIHRDPNLEIS